MTFSFLTSGAIPVRKRISFRLLRNVAIAVLILECLLASGQILLDYTIQSNDLKSTATQLLNMVEDAAVHAVWTLDNEEGENLLAGLLRHEAIVKAKLEGVKGESFALAEKATSSSTPMARWVFGSYHTYELPLKESLGDEPPEYIGSIALTLDSGVLGADFFKRTISFLITGLLMNMVLAAILLSVFHKTMTRSILSVGDALAKVDPQEPGGHRIPLPPKHRDDELGLLVRNTNDLLQAVGDNIDKRLEMEGEVLKLNRELESRVIERTRELELANRELEAFSYSVSHDLRGPVRGINGLSTALIEDYGDKLDPNAKRCLELLQTSSEQMDSLIDGLLKLSRSTRGDILPQPVNLSALVSDALGEMRQFEPGRSVESKVASNVHVVADPRLLKAVVKNLIGNAWKYTGKKSEPVIEFGVTEMDGEPVYYVRDNGAGFDMSQANRIFKPFQRLHSGEEFAGTGIGLATVDRIIRRHAGRIWAESEINKGATFYFTLGVVKGSE